MTEYRRMQWKRRFEFLFTSFGYTIGLGNIWRFPAMCATHGGGLFLIPYLLTVVLCTFPMLVLEIALGQFSSAGPIQAWRMSPIFVGIGCAILFNTIITNIYYVTIVMYALYYMLVSFVSIGGMLPWQQCRPDEDDWSTDSCRTEPYPDFSSMVTSAEKINSFKSLMDPNCVKKTFDLLKPDLDNSITSVDNMQFDDFKINFTHCEKTFSSPEEEYWNRYVLNVHESGGLNDLGKVVGRNAFLLFIIWLIVFYCCVRGIRSIAKMIYITATFPFGLLLILLLRGVTLTGHEVGLHFYTQPDWSKLGDMEIWSAAATQAFYSMGIAYGSHIALASYNKFNNNFLRDALIIGLANTLTSVLSGLVVFSFLGYASTRLHKPIDEIVAEGPSILFVSYVQGVSHLPGAAFWSFLFFMMVFTLGLDTEVVFVWTLYSSLEDVYPSFFKRFRKLILIVMCVFYFLLGLPLVTKGGIHMIVVMDRYVADFTLTLFLIMEIVSVCLVYGIKNFMSDIEMMVGKQHRFLRWYAISTWAGTVPVFCLFIIVASVIGYSTPSYNDVPTPGWGEAIGWFIIITPILIIIISSLWQIYRIGGLRQAAKPDILWGPKDPADQQGRYMNSHYHEANELDNRQNEAAVSTLYDNPYFVNEASITDGPMNVNMAPISQTVIDTEDAPPQQCSGLFEK